MKTSYVLIIITHCNVTDISLRFKADSKHNDGKVRNIIMCNNNNNLLPTSSFMIRNHTSCPCLMKTTEEQCRQCISRNCTPKLLYLSLVMGLFSLAKEELINGKSISNAIRRKATEKTKEVGSNSQGSRPTPCS